MALPSRRIFYTERQQGWMELTATVAGWGGTQDVASWHIPDLPRSVLDFRSRVECVAKLGEGWLVRNNRIVAKGFLNQWCDAVAILESILLAQTPEIVLQHIRVINGPALDSPG